MVLGPNHAIIIAHRVLVSPYSVAKLFNISLANDLFPPQRQAITSISNYEPLAFRQ